MDIQPFSICDLVGDAHYLPFADNSIATVVSSNVFEYLKNPFQVAAEIKRVLKPGGTLYLSVALILPLSTPDYQDRFRYAKGGLVSLCSDLDIISIEPSTGPFVACGTVIDRLVDVTVPGRHLGYLARFGFGWMLHPFKFLDPWILRRDSHEQAAAGYCIVAQKRTTQDTRQSTRRD